MIQEIQKKFFDDLLKANSVLNGECLEWTGKTYHGYGQIYAFKRGWQTHRISYELKNGEIPANLYICHRCNNKKCFNTEHLYAGTPRENTQDYRKSDGFWESIKKGIETKKLNKKSKEDHPLPAEFLTVEETAQKFGVHPNTIYAALQKGYLVGIRIGSGIRSPYRISIKSIEAIHSSILRDLATKTRKSASFLDIDKLSCD